VHSLKKEKGIFESEVILSGEKKGGNGPDGSDYEKVKLR
jgi:hypothetical protein